MLKYITYVSQTQRPMSQDELASLLKHSRARNYQDEITGCLVYRYNDDFDRGNFLQVLEGPEAAIDDVWKRISSDSRHHTIVTIDEGRTQGRMFSSWSMGFRNVDAEDLKHAEGFSDLGSDAFWAEIDEKNLSSGLELLKSFYDG